MLLLMLDQELAALVPDFPAYQEGGVYHRHPVYLGGLRTLLDGDLLGASSPFVLVKALTDLAITVDRYNEFIRSSNVVQPAILDRPAYHREQYDALQSAYGQVLDVADRVRALDLQALAGERLLLGP